MNRFTLWISLLCAVAILYVGQDFLAPIFSGLVLAFGLSPFQDSFLFKKIPTPRGRKITLLLVFLAVFSTLGTYVVIASARGIARNVDLQNINGKNSEDINKELLKNNPPLYEEKTEEGREPDASSEAANKEALPDSVPASDVIAASASDAKPSIREKAQKFLEDIPGLNTEEITKIWSEIFTRARALALVVLSKILTAGPTIFVQWVLFLIAFIVFYLSYSSILSFLHSFEKKSKDIRECVNFFQNATQATLMGTLVVGSAQATIITIGTAIAGLESYVLLGLCAFFASFIPFVGTALVWVSTLIYCLINGDTQAAIIVGVAGAISSVADNLILPTFIGAKNKVHPLLLFIVVIGLIERIGIWGLFIGPVLAIFSTRVFELWYRSARA